MSHIGDVIVDDEHEHDDDDDGCFGAELDSDPLAAEIRVLLSRQSDASALAAEIGCLCDSEFQPGLSLASLNEIAEALRARRWTSITDWSMQQAGDWTMPSREERKEEESGERDTTKKAHKRSRKTTKSPKREKNKSSVKSSSSSSSKQEPQIWRTTLEFNAAGTPIVMRLPHNAAVFTVFGARSRKDATTECVKFALVDKPPASSYSTTPSSAKTASLSKTRPPEPPALLKPLVFYLRAVRRFVRSPEEGGFFIELSMEWSGATFAEAEEAIHSGYAQNFRAKIVWPNLEDFRYRHAQKADEHGDEEEDDEEADIRAVEYAVRDILEQVRSIFQHPPDTLCAIRTPPS